MKSQPWENKNEPLPVYLFELNKEDALSNDASHQPEESSQLFEDNYILPSRCNGGVFI